MIRTLLGKGGLALASLLVAVFLAEGVVRHIEPQQLIRLRPDVWIPDDDLGWRRASNLDTTVNTGEASVRLVTDDRGRRIAAGELFIGKQEPAQATLILGDSFTAGLQVRQEETFSAILQAAMEHRLRKPQGVLNGGVSGWDPNQYLAAARQELSEGAYDLVVVVLFVGNDIVATRLDSLSPRLPVNTYRLRWPKSLKKRELIQAVAYPINDALERRSHLYLLARGRAWSWLMRAGLSARSLPSSLLSSEAGSPRWSVTADLCADIAAAAQARDAAALFLLLPGAYQASPDLGRRYAQAVGIPFEKLDLEQPGRRMGEELERRGLIYLDALPALRQATNAGERLYGSVDTHLNAAGHLLVAHLLAQPVESILRQKAASRAES